MSEQNSINTKLLLDRVFELEVNHAAALAVIEQMRGVLREAREALQFANDPPNGPICDTIWMMHRPETLFDSLDDAITLQPDLAALRKRDAETLRKAAGEVESRAHVVGPQELRRMADRIEKGEETLRKSVLTMNTLPCNNMYMDAAIPPIPKPGGSK